MKKNISGLGVCMISFILVFSALGSLGIESSPIERESSADVMTAAYSFPAPSLTTSNGLTKVQLEEGSGYMDSAGAPRLPFATATLLLPQGKTYTSLIISGEQKTLANSILVEWSGIPVIISDSEQHTKTEKNQEIYNSDLPYPGSLYSTPSVQGLRGAYIIIFNLYPVQYIPSTGTINYIEKMNVIIELADGLPLQSDVKFRGLESDFASIYSTVDNPEVLSTYMNGDGQSILSPGPENKIQLNPGSWDMVIITDETFLSNFQPLVNHRNSKGVATTVFTLQNIYTQYSGVDDQDKIRKFIIDAYNQWGVEYVLLGADAQGVSGQPYLPHRGLYAVVGAYVDDDVPSDLYYSCLDGPWNNDGDSNWGEYNDGSGGAIPDYYAEVYIGRAPVSTTTEVTTFVNKVIGFENNPRSKKITLHGSTLWPGCSAKEIKTIGCPETGDKGVDDYVPLDWNKSTLYEPDIPTISVAMWEAEFTGGRQIINHGGHGSTESYYVDGDGVTYYDTDADDIVNSERGIHLSIACYSGAFDGRDTSPGVYAADRDCIAEEYIINPDGGFTACILNSRYGWGQSTPGQVPTYSGELDIDWYRELFDMGHNRVGNTTAKARENIAPKATSVGADNCYRWCMYEWNLLGDPAMEIMDPPHVAVTQPNTALTWVSGSSHDVTWIATVGSYLIANNAVSIYYSTNGPGGPWALIATNEVNDGSYSWLVNNTPSTNCYVKVSVMDIQNPSLVGMDISDVAFTISDIDPPNVTVIQPNTPLTWCTGSSNQITWAAIQGTNPLAAGPISIYYSTTGSSGPWMLLTSGEANDGAYAWIVNNTPSTNCYVRVDAVDNQGNYGSDISDYAFIIQLNPPTVWVSAPNGGEYYNGGGNRFINWTAIAGGNPLLANPITIEYSSAGSTGPWSTVANNEANDGFYIWTVPMLNSSNCYVRVTAYDTGGLSAQDASNASFEIDSIRPLPASNARAELTGTNDVTIYWTASPSADIAYYLVYYISNNWDQTGDSYSVLGNVTGSNFVHTSAGNNSATEYCYQVRAYDRANNEARCFMQAAKYTKIISASSTVAWGGWIALGSSLTQSSYAFSHKLQGQGFGTQGFNNWSAVELYNAWDNANHWKLNLRNGTASLNEITTINNTQGFWACVYNSARYTSAGYVSNVTIPLKTGWNLVPYPYVVRNKNTQQIRDDLTANCSGFAGGYAGMEIFSKTGYRTATPTGVETLSHQDALWVRVTTDCTWNVINY